MADDDLECVLDLLQSLTVTDTSQAFLVPKLTEICVHEYIFWMTAEHVTAFLNMVESRSAGIGGARLTDAEFKYRRRICPPIGLDYIDSYVPDSSIAERTRLLSRKGIRCTIRAISLIRIKANVSTDSTEYRGPILCNPGGPGGGGIDLIIARGPLLAQIVGPQFDVVAFDPRGIAHSTPRIEFFESREERALWYIPAASELNHSSIDVASFWARHKVNGQLVQERFIDLLPYFTTSHVAQDMLRIAEAHGKEKLQYWGFSYGSVLGSTFAAMFPDKVERLIIDGIVDVENDYYTTDYKGLPLDLDKALNWFFKDCLDAGPEACPFHDTSIEAMRERLNKLYESVIKAPVAVRTEVSYGLVDYGNLRGLILIGLYSPLRWPRLAAGLAGLEAGNGTALWKIGADVPPFSCSCDSSEFAFENVLDARQAYVCNDGDVVSSSLEDAQKHYQESVEISEWNSLFATFKIECR
ncbi:hypothetical protein VNI00_013182 [Paramarasmius palmivorus]|uniref:AB hydrolase-1 domain-containing protein n=1 Tax=Paramarasmius palmivorus TaxID=297713 RepID=A0AAW0C1I1_9AGAR